MKMKMIKSTWGMPGTSLLEKTRQIIEAGYEGIETVIPQEDEIKPFLAMVKEHKLELIVQVFTEGGDHFPSLREQVEQAAKLEPTLINSHSLKDSTPYDAQRAFFEKALRLEEAVGVRIGHETHRGRAFFTPWNTANMLKEYQELKITADFSHFCCVCESLLADQSDNLRTIINNSIHIHARVGYAEGPQVPHPAAPEYRQELEAHEGWWEQILLQNAKRGKHILTVTPEFGPPGYLHTLPFTNHPVADLWDLTAWMSGRLKERFASYC
ncbi:MAG: sugar phosphate isomerase/epimerase [Paenibacillus sp.]|nr:sugar phosphate isomerase/epimerase [Paenibacillus sp.]